jgi:antitoxin (DNA-binding transcriptional repressor) of toxin-antitoxin stability system
MDELASTEFRKRFARLKEDVLVTVNGHPIGAWVPLKGDKRITITLPEEATRAERNRAFTQAQRDELLRKINKR